MSDNPRNHPYRVLIIEDHPSHLLLTRRHLERRGFQVFTALDGVEGISIAFREMPDVIVSDVLMPELNGYQVCYVLKDDPLTCSIPIVLLTCLDSKIDRFWGAEAGADLLIHKEQMEETLVDAIEELAERRSRYSEQNETLNLSRESAKSRVSEILESLLLESSITNRFRNITHSNGSTEQTARSSLTLLSMLLDIRIAVLSLPLYRRETEFVLARQEHVKEVERLLTGDGSPTNAERILVGDPDEDPEVGGIEDETPIHLSLHSRDGSCGRLSILLTRRPGKKTRRILNLIQAEMSLVAERVIQTERLAGVQTRIENAYRQTERLLSSISSVLIGVDAHGRVTRWNAAAEQTFGMSSAVARGRLFQDCGIEWLDKDAYDRLMKAASTDDDRPLDDFRFCCKGKERLFSATLHRVLPDERGESGFIVLGNDVTEMRIAQQQKFQSRKLEAIGNLAAGVAHEINTPTQYVVNNTKFLNEAFTDLLETINIARDLVDAERSEGDKDEIGRKLLDAVETADLEYLSSEIPKAILQSIDGLERVTNIVAAIAQFSHPGEKVKTSQELSKLIESSLTVARSQWRSIAVVETEFDADLPKVLGHGGELSQVFLNLIVNSTHAIADRFPIDKDEPKAELKGRIRVSTHRMGEDLAEVRICDNGAGIPLAIRDRVFDPFFTTKEVGRGTGQGLALAHDVIVDMHGGKIWFESKEGEGSTFFIRIPITYQGATDSEERPTIPHPLSTG